MLLISYNIEHIGEDARLLLEVYLSSENVKRIFVDH